jgi:amino acid adenylation domain-containing protein
MADPEGVTGRRSALSASKQELLAKRLAGAGAPGHSGVIGRRERKGPFPLSFAQQRLWILDRLTPGGSTYNVPYAYRLGGGVSVGALENALTEIVRRHEVLRTTFTAVDGAPLQNVGPPLRVNVGIRDLRSVPEGDRESAAMLELHEEAHRGFDLERGPLMRVTLIRLSDEESLLVLVFHHIVFDGWSESIFFRELSALYETSPRGAKDVLPDLPIQYGDFVLWQREWLQGEVLGKQLAYWKEKLGGSLPVLELPADKTRPAVQTHKGLTEFMTIPAPLYAALTQLGKEEGVTLFMTLLSAFNVLLSRYSGQEDLIVGTPVAGRTRMEVEGLTGFFVNTLVLRTDMGGNPTFRELLKRAREVCLGALEHQEVPFEKIVEELQPERSLTHSPLFQVMFVLQSAPEGRITLGRNPANKLDVSTDTAKFDVTLSMMERSGELVGWLQCNADLFERGTITRMAGHFVALLQGIVADPGRCLWQIPIMTEAERREVTTGWNSTHSDYPSGMTISSLFEDQVRSSPDAVALEDDLHQVTYRDLNSRANRLARFLRARGVGPESCVGVALDRSVDLIVGLLAILKAGGTYVPLEISYPIDRISYILDDARVGLILAYRSHGDELPPRSAEVIFLDAQSEDIGRESDEDLPVTGSPDALAYVMYTSGSTGVPKGVCVPHRGVVRLVRSNDYAALNSGEVFLLFASISFDASTFEIWGSLLNGARLVIFPPGLPSLDGLGRLIRDTGVTTLWLTASLFRHMVDGPLDLLGGVRQLLTGGEVLPVPQVRKFLETYPRCRLINGYGPTENTTFTCCYTVAGETGITTSVPIGRPIRNTRVYILDRFMQPVPVGIPGELFIAGDGLARGYLNSPDLTAEKFVAGPAGSVSPERLYRSGDLARYRPDGNIEFIGRVDNQVKIRGFRVELEEIEAVLARHPGVREAVVTVAEFAPGDKRLVAHCVVDVRSAGSAGAMRDSLKSKLPEYMIPSAFVFLDSLPRNSSGKVDRVLLSASAPSGAVDPGGATVEEMSPTENALAGILARILGVERVGMNDNFFSLGGHSLLAMQVVSRIRDRWRIELSLVSVFEYPTVGKLALAIEEKLLDQIENLSDDEV